MFTGSKHPQFNSGKQVPESKLLLGELSATTFHVGCYTVRSSVRIYKVSEPSYIPDDEVPATQEEVERVRKDTNGGETLLLGFHSWWNDLRVTHEISARHSSWGKDEFTYICRAAQARNLSWSESISSICAAKEHPLLPDNRASLFVCNSYMGSSFGAETWYQLPPSGRIKQMHLHDLAENNDEARFE